MARTRVCIFCGNSPLNREHIFPEWMKDYLGIARHTVIEAIGKNGQVRRHTSRPFEHKAKVVCPDCNHGWMSRLENEVKAYLGPMTVFTDKAIQLTSEQQKNLAFWAVKTLFVAQYASGGPPIIGSEHYMKLYKTQAPSPETRVMMSFRDTSYNKAGETLVGIDTKEVGTIVVPKEELSFFQAYQENGERPYFSALRVGRVVFYISGHNIEDAETGHTKGIPISYLVDLWPTTNFQTISFPSTLPIDMYGGAEKMFDHLYETMGIRRLS